MRTDRPRAFAAALAATGTALLIILAFATIWPFVQHPDESSESTIALHSTHNTSSPHTASGADELEVATSPEEPNDEPVQNHQRQEHMSKSQEYAVPIKKLPPPIQEHDLLYDSPAQSLRHHSGHFRHRLTDIWDPHPEYEFTAFNRTFHLSLQHAQSFVSPKLQVTNVWRNMTVQEDPDVKPTGCFYSGIVLGDPHSSVSVNLCHGMTGHIRTSEGSYFIEPSEPYKDHETPIRHTVSKLPSVAQNRCHHDNIPHTDRSGNAEDASEEILVDNLTRRKRSLSQEYFIEIMVVADRKMQEYHGQELKFYILTLMGMVAQIFKDASIGNPISVAVVKLYVLKDDDLVGVIKGNQFGVSSSDLLRTFCDWQHRRNDQSDNSPNHHDTALLITRENLCRDPTKPNTCDTLGLAELGTMCDKYSSCSIVRDNGLSAAFTIAHELGHVLNMPHEEDQKCQKLGADTSSMHNIMSRILDNNTKPWYWSNCSRHFLTEYLDVGYGSCLSDPPQWDYVEDRERKGQLPGEVYSDSRQCELVYGHESRSCSYMPVCQSLWCTRDTGAVCTTQHMPWADGTPCGHYGGNMAWCRKGECVPKDPRALLPINGGWGPWKPYGECSRTCGGGVKQAVRDCNNPRPANGGRYCVGRRIRYKSCATWECPPGSTDFRELQCASFNNDQSISIQGMSKEISWVPKYGGIAHDDRCKLYCRVAGTRSYYLLKKKVIDGTVCGPDTYDICVNGVCRPAGCDHILNSTTELDNCGQCGGNNSTCQVVSGRYDVSQYGYSTVVRIPEGSSNLDIRQTGHMNTNKDDNYLALVDSETGDFILNGNHSVSMFRKVILYGKTTLEYSGSDATVERINSSRPLTKDLIVMVLSVGNLYPPNIVYQYTVQKSTLARYKWVLSDQWSSCDKVCNGESHKDAICVRVDGGEQVAQEMCEGLEKPESPAKPCNKHCILKWEVTSLTECSSHCGPGERILNAQCVQAVLVPKSRRVPVDNSSCTHLPRPPSTEPCLGPCDEARWNFTQWGPCSKTCGEGIQRRSAFCIDELNRPRNESECRQSEKKIERVCSLQKCPQWGFGDWDPCSVTCGTGYRRRPYWCHEDNLIVSTSHCSNQPVPHHLTVETCSLDACPSWITHEWSSCSVSCGVGEQTRLVECSTSEVECSSATKPPTVKSCTMNPCSLRHENALPDIDNSAVHKFSWKPKAWGSCSVTCGEGVRWREADCFDEKNRRFTDPRECLSQSVPIKKIEKCYKAKCPKWEETEWGPCSAICDQGIQTREVKCVGHRGMEVDERYCDRDSRPDTERVCQAANRCHGSKEYWKTGPWSQCSVTCGGGYRNRKVFCENGRCQEPRPPTAQPCNPEPCSLGYWKHGNWSQCSVTCGSGSKFRLVRCRSLQGVDLPEEACSRDPKPKQSEVCRNQPCSNYIMYDWQHSRHWTPCSKSCGKGMRHRKVWCSTSDGNRVNDTFCSGTRKPKSVRECKRANCPFDWTTQPWSQCSVTCGRGYQTRVVHCYGYRGLGQGAPSVVDSSYCSNSTKPITVQECLNQHCSKPSKSYHWVPGPWQQCSERCSRRGKQIRKLFCYSGNVKVRKINCPKAKRPERRKKCQTERCQTCSEIQQSTNSRRDGEYMLYVSNKRVSIYCYSMNTAHPREYLSLHASRENYAEIYDKRLIDVNTCPDNGQRTENCKCVRNTQPNVGFTVFKKIRLNLTTLVVETKDWTFANIVRGNRVAYGEAGDCYSKIGCPQGQFRINLERTGFRVSHKQLWHKYGHHVFHDILKYQDNIKIVGICGGFCGMCRPHRGLKLDVLPP